MIQLLLCNAVGHGSQPKQLIPDGILPDLLKQRSNSDGILSRSRLNNMFSNSLKSPYSIITRCNTISSNFRDRFQRVGMRPRIRRCVGLPRKPSVRQIIQTAGSVLDKAGTRYVVMCRL